MVGPYVSLHLNESDSVADIADVTYSTELDWVPNGADSGVKVW